MHTLHCMRNITLCTICDEPIPKRELEDHKQQCSAKKDDNMVANNDLQNGCAENSNIPKVKPPFLTSNSCSQKSIEKEKVFLVRGRTI